MKHTKPTNRNRNYMKVVKLNYNDYSILGDNKPAEKDGNCLCCGIPATIFGSMYKEAQP